MAEDGYRSERVGNEYEPVSEEVWRAIVGGYAQIGVAAQHIEPVQASIANSQENIRQCLRELDLQPSLLDDASQVSFRGYRLEYKAYQEYLGALNLELLLRQVEYERVVASCQRQVGSLLNGKVLYAKGSEQHAGFILTDDTNLIVGTAYRNVFGLYDRVDLTRGAIYLRLPEGVSRATYAYVQLFSPGDITARLCELFAKPR